MRFVSATRAHGSLNFFNRIKSVKNEEFERFGHMILENWTAHGTMMFGDCCS